MSATTTTHNHVEYTSGDTRFYFDVNGDKYPVDYRTQFERWRNL